MKNRIYAIALFCLVGLVSACDSDDDNTSNAYETSKQVWLNFKAENSNTYQYTATESSWAGYGWETTLTVENGIVTERHFKYTQTPLDHNLSEEELEWTETDDQIGSHENGAQPLTLDEIYTLAEENWLTERENATIYFETENNGMISICGYVESNCADDCFIGIKIKSIEAYYTNAE
ncbi:MAG: hypothetical protein ACK5NB_00405 [Flavobacteriaceae bacterium]